MPEQVNFVLFYPHADLFSNPSLLVIIRRLLDKGAKVLLVTEHRLKLLPDGFESLVVLRQPAVYPRPRRPLLYIRNYLLPLIRLRAMVSSLNRCKVLAVDIKGLLMASSLMGKHKRDLNYISFEILSMDEIPRGIYRQMKEHEINILQKGISSILIQDKYRLSLFNQANPGNKVGGVFYLPVAPMLRYRRDGVPKAHQLARVVYSGSLWEWSGIEDVLQNLPVNGKFILTVHHRFPEWDKSPAIRQIESLIAAGKPLQLHNKGYEPNDYFEYLKNFDIGLVTYKPDPSTGMYNGKNFENIGYSSGKFSTFMALGIPVIVTASASYNDLIKIYRFGYILQDFSEIELAVEHICRHYAIYSAEAKRLFDEVLDPALYIQPYLDHLLAVEEKN